MSVKEPEYLLVLLNLNANAKRKGSESEASEAPMAERSEAGTKPFNTNNAYVYYIFVV